MSGMTENPLYTKHAETLARALTAIAERDYWSAFPESPSPRVYGEEAAPAGQGRVRVVPRQAFPIDQPGDAGRHRDQPVRDPAGRAAIHTPMLDTLISAATAAMPAWRDAGPKTRAGVCLEILVRLHQTCSNSPTRCTHTSGQAFVMAFQAGGPHALDRALEAVAYAYAEQTRHPGGRTWTKPAGKGEPLRMEKTFRVVPRGWRW